MSSTVGCYVVDLLIANGIDTVFGIPGVHNIELYRGLSRDGIRHILVRHEQGAGFAADGFARVSGTPAAAFVISGPGLTNILTAAAQAYSDSVPLMVVATTPVSQSLGKRWGVLHELHNQYAVAVGVFGVARAARSAEDVRDHLRACLASLRVGRARPAYLEIPLDLLSENTDLVAAKFNDVISLPQPDRLQIEAAVKLLASAARPLIIAGGGARRAALELQHLVENIDGFLMTTVAGKGVMSELHCASLGACLPYAPAQSLIAEADVILAVGTELAETDFYSGMRLPFSARLIRVDVDPAKLSDHYGAEVPIWGDATTTLRALNQGLSAKTGWRTRIGSTLNMRARIESGFDAKTRLMQAALAAIRAAVPAETVVLTDMTQIAYLGNYAYLSEAPGLWFHPSGYGTLGFALPAALGAKISSPARTIIALAGDFGIQFTLGELMTAVESGLSLPIIVWNNLTLGQIRDDMLGAHISPVGVVARNPDFVALAQACGAVAVRAHNAASLSQAVRNALIHAGPTLIEVVANDFSE